MTLNDYLKYLAQCGFREGTKVEKSSVSYLLKILRWESGFLPPKQVFSEYEVVDSTFAIARWNVE